MSEKIHYFRAVQGRVCPRFGTAAFIGATRSTKGFIINPDAVVAITDVELTAYRKSYDSALRHGDLKRATKVDYDAYQIARTAASKAQQATTAGAQEQPAVDVKKTKKTKKNESAPGGADGGDAA